MHPENYEAARELFAVIKSGGDVSAELKKKLEEKYGIGETTISDIVKELKKPNRDPRDDYPAPIMQKGVVQFEDLKPGMKPVADFVLAEGDEVVAAYEYCNLHGLWRGE